MNYSFLDEYEPVKITPPPKTMNDLKNNIYSEHDKVCTNKNDSCSYKILDGNDPCYFRTIQCNYCGKYLRKDGIDILTQTENVENVESVENVTQTENLESVENVTQTENLENVENVEIKLVINSSNY